MGSNKIACVHITREDVRLLEGRVNNGVMLVTNTATMPKASRFFHGPRLAFMSEMVSAILNTMEVSGFTAKTLHIVYDNSVVVDFFLDEKLEKRKNQNSLFNFGGKKGENEEQVKKPKETGSIVHKKPWGKYVTEMEQGELYTTVTIERDFVDFLVTEFQEHGYRVSSLETPETALMYLRKFVRYSYDALTKLVIYANNQNDGVSYLFTKDAPSGATHLHFDDVAPTGTFVDKLVETVREEIRKKKLVNPHIMLVGDAFGSAEEYVACCEALKNELGLYCLDMYASWRDRGAPFNCMRVIKSDIDETEVTLDGRYGICICLLARTLENKPENLIEGWHPMLMSKDTKRIGVEMLNVFAILTLMVGIAAASISTYEVIVANKEYTRASTATEVTLTAVEAARDSVKAKLESIDTIDARYKDIFTFVHAQVNKDLNIASVDTKNLIPVGEVTDSNYAEDESAENKKKDESSQTEDNGPVDVTTTINGGSGYAQQVIVIRGYARTTDGPVKLYNALVSKNLGEVKVVGVEQVELPSTETLFAFELTVGTNEGG